MNCPNCHSDRTLFEAVNYKHICNNCGLKW